MTVADVSVGAHAVSHFQIRTRFFLPQIRGEVREMQAAPDLARVIHGVGIIIAGAAAITSTPPAAAIASRSTAAAKVIRRAALRG